MKIAVQFSGQLRSFIQPYNFFKKNLLDRIDCDIFLSTWSSMPAQLFREDIDQCQIAIDKFKELYKPVAVRADELRKGFLQPNIDACMDGFVEPIKNVKIDYMVYGFYHKYMCNKLRQKYERQKNFKYDVIIVVRPDLVLAEPFPIHLLEYTKDYLLIPAGSDWECGTNDLLAVGNNLHITLYCSLFCVLKTYMKKRILVHPEHLNKYHLDEFKVPRRRFSYSTHLRGRKMT